MSEFVFTLPDEAETLEVIAAVGADQGQHLARALERLAEQFKGRTKIEALITALMTAFQDVENALQQVLLERTIDTATGVQLDMLGVIVGQDRGGLSDADYRRFVRARIAVHRSKGTTSDMIRIGALIVNDPAAKFVVRTVWDAGFILEVTGVAVSTATASALIAMLRAAVSGGVRILVVSSSVAPSQTFRFDTGPGLDVGHLAAGSDNT